MGTDQGRPRTAPRSLGAANRRFSNGAGVPDDDGAAGSVAHATEQLPATLVGQGALAGSRFVLAEPVTLIGRAEDCHVRVPDPMASRHHAEVRREPWRYVLVD